MNTAPRTAVLGCADTGNGSVFQTDPFPKVTSGPGSFLPVGGKTRPNQRYDEKRVACYGVVREAFERCSFRRKCSVAGVMR